MKTFIKVLAISQMLLGFIAFIQGISSDSSDAVIGSIVFFICGMFTFIYVRESIDDLAQMKSHARTYKRELEEQKQMVAMLKMQVEFLSNTNAQLNIKESNKK